MPEVRIGPDRIVYRVEIRPRRRRAAIRVDAAGGVTVLLPPAFDPADVPSLLRRHAAWILKHLAAPSARSSLAPGATVYWLGRPLHLDVTTGTTPRVMLQADRLRVTLRSGAAPTAVGHAVLGWLRQEAERDLPARLDGWARRFGRYPSGLVLAPYRSQWGRCRDDGEIALNIGLMQAPSSAIDYVICHELVHLSHPHHQRPFWEAVSRLYPAHEEARRWLRDHRRDLIWW